MKQSVLKHKNRNKESWNTVCSSISLWNYLEVGILPLQESQECHLRCYGLSACGVGFRSAVMEYQNQNKTEVEVIRFVVF